MNKLEIHSVEGKGDLHKECLWLKANEDIPKLEFYMIGDTTFTDDDHVSNEVRHTYWFRPKAVKKGDWIQLATKVGKDTEFINQQSTTTHVFFWGLGRTVWNKDGDCAILFDLTTWHAKRA